MKQSFVTEKEIPVSSHVTQPEDAEGPSLNLKSHHLICGYRTMPTGHIFSTFSFHFTKHNTQNKNIFQKEDKSNVIKDFYR